MGYGSDHTTEQRGDTMPPWALDNEPTCKSDVHTFRTNVKTVTTSTLNAGIRAECNEPGLTLDQLRALVRETENAPGDTVIKMMNAVPERFRGRLGMERASDFRPHSLTVSYEETV